MSSHRTRRTKSQVSGASRNRRLSRQQRANYPQRQQSRKGVNPTLGPGNEVLLKKPAVQLAEQALTEQEDGGVGRYLGAHVQDHNVVVHRFQADVVGYAGWEWNVVVACAPGSSQITVNELALVPGRGALRAPKWVPYIDRLRPEDLGPRSLLPPLPDDARLEKTTEGNFALSDAGAAAATARWLRGETGPRSVFAKAAEHPCASCAFYVPLAGKIGAEFGVCVNEYSRDGRVVHSKFGCGAHSETKGENDRSRPALPFTDEAPIEL